MNPLTIEIILREAADEHHAAEERLPEHDWQAWYALYMTARFDGADAERANQLADAYITMGQDYTLGEVDAECVL